MDDEVKSPSTPEDETVFMREVSAQAARKLKFQKDGSQSVWFGLGMAGIVGWSVAVPTLGGAMFGLWLDHRHPGSRSWTLMLLAIGLVVGCANAWHWVTEQDDAMHEKPEHKDG
jgi:ATP synthase protein I